jgi:hypothetical protein
MCTDPGLQIPRAKIMVAIAQHSNVAIAKEQQLIKILDAQS